LSKEFTKWNKEVFGSIQGRKGDLMAQIGGIQRKLHTNRHNKFLEKLERQLQQELALVLKQEEAMCFKSPEVNGLRTSTEIRVIITLKPLSEDEGIRF
jgi:hypothetical protein